MIALMSRPIITKAATVIEPRIQLTDALSFGVLGYSTITNTGTTTISGTAGGDVGVYALTAITGKETMSITGEYHEADEKAGLAQAALAAAITDAKGRTATTIETELGTQTLTGGVYTSESGTFGLTGELILDGQNNSETVFIFMMASTLITADASRVTLINGAQACNVFWQVGSSATLGTNSTLAGHILATESITANTGATVNGSLLANTGAVTLSGNSITNNSCVASTATLTIIKHVINDNTGTLLAANFNLHLKLNDVDVAGSPAVGSETGVVYTLNAGTYVISEGSTPGYLATYSGDSITGTITLAAGESKTITVTNNDINPNMLPDTGEQDMLLLAGGLMLAFMAAWLLSNKKVI